MTEPPTALRADCARCFGLCCVVPAFSASADFAVDKAPEHPCPRLGTDFRCGVHDRLRPLGFPGCTVYDCFGAGQAVSQGTFGGRDWLRSPALAPTMFAVFRVMEALHELRWYLAEARTLPLPSVLQARVHVAAQELHHASEGAPEAVVSLDVAALRQQTGALLAEVSQQVRTRAGNRLLINYGRADLVEAHLAGTDLAGATLRGALLLGADLRGADLRDADLLGADLRAADLRGADLSTSLFLTQFQVNAARGDATTRLPGSVDRPPHW